MVGVLAGFKVGFRELGSILPLLRVAGECVRVRRGEEIRGTPWCLVYSPVLRWNLDLRETRYRQKRTDVFSKEPAAQLEECGVVSFRV